MKRKEKPKKPRKSKTPNEGLKKDGGRDPNSFKDPRPGLKPWDFGDSKSKAPENVPSPIQEPPAIEESVRLQISSEVLEAVQQLDGKDDLMRVRAAIRILDRFETLGKQKELSGLDLEEFLKDMSQKDKAEQVRLEAFDYLLWKPCVRSLKHIAAWGSDYTDETRAAAFVKLDAMFENPQVRGDFEFLRRMLRVEGHDPLRDKAIRAMEDGVDELLKKNSGYEFEDLLAVSKSESVVMKIAASLIAKDYINYVMQAAEKNELVKRIGMQQLKRQAGLLLSYSDSDALRNFMYKELPEEVKALVISRLISEDKAHTLLELLQHTKLSDALEKRILDHLISTKNVTALMEISTPSYSEDLKGKGKVAMDALCSMVDAFIESNAQEILSRISCFGLSEARDKAIRYFIDNKNIGPLFKAIRRTKDADEKRRLLETVISIDERNAAWMAQGNEGLGYGEFKSVIDILRARKSCMTLMQLQEAHLADRDKKELASAIESLLDHMKAQKLLEPLMHLHKNGSSQAIKDDALDAALNIMEESLSRDSLPALEKLSDYSDSPHNRRIDSMLCDLIDRLVEEEDTHCLKKIKDTFGFPNHARNKADWKFRWLSLKNTVKGILKRMERSSGQSGGPPEQKF